MSDARPSRSNKSTPGCFFQHTRGGQAAEDFFARRAFSGPQPLRLRQGDAQARHLRVLGLHLVHEPEYRCPDAGVDAPSPRGVRPFTSGPKSDVLHLGCLKGKSRSSIAVSIAAGNGMRFNDLRARLRMVAGSPARGHVADCNASVSVKAGEIRTRGRTASSSARASPC